MADKLEMMSGNVIQENIDYIASKFPNAVTEVKENGKLVKKVDFDILKQELSKELINDKQERYQITWPEKTKSILVANSSINKTLKPCLDSSVDFFETKNCYIEGDNLDVLKLIRETYLNEVKLIYIDPPYNTGTDLIYKNNFEMNEEEFKKANYDIDSEGYIISVNSDRQGKFHTNWINMMYSRIKVARDLLTSDGCMVIAIDHNELINLVKICDEIFFESNRVGIVSVVHKPEGRNQEKFFATSNEFALFYAKDKSQFNFNSVILDESKKAEYTLSDDKGMYKLIPAIAKNHGRSGYDKNLKRNNPKNHFPVYVRPDCSEITLDYKEGYLTALPNTKTQERTWKYIKDTFKKKCEEGEFVAKIENNEAVIYEKYREESGQLIKTHWIDKRYNAMVYGTKLLDVLMKTKTFDFPKSLYLIKDIIKLTTNKDSIILDFFSGSATTAHAVLDVNLEDNGNRKHIMIQLPEKTNEKSESYKSGYLNICEIGKERIRRAGKKIKEEADVLGFKLDIGFRVFKLDSSNMKDVYYNPNTFQQVQLDKVVSNIKEDRTPLDLMFQVMLELGIELSAKIEEKDIFGKTCFIVNENDIVACFDDGINDEVIKELACIKSIYAVFKDSAFSSDAANINCEQIFKSISPSTNIKVI